MGLDPAGLEQELSDLFAQGVDSPLPDAAFNDLALRVFRFQFERNRIFGAYAEARGRTPDTVDRWEEIPPVPTRAFKELPLVAGDPEEVARTFRTSGTTEGTEARGAHGVVSLRLYDASLLPNFQAHLLPDRPRIRILSLLPPPERVPSSSLAYMMGRAASVYGDGFDDFFLDEHWRLDFRSLHDALDRAVHEGAPVLLAGTAFAFVHFLDGSTTWRGPGPKALPEGSRIMETGGFKGRSRAVTREELYQGLRERFGIPTRGIVNEYGMTELLSQFYEPVLRSSPGGEAPTDGQEEEWLSERSLTAPPWVRTRVLDPTTLDPLESGRPGLLAHFDLANLHSVSYVLTEDHGVSVGPGFRVLGRSPGAEPRGCSLAMEEVLASQERR